GSGIQSPSDFVGKTYAGWGSEMEELMVRTVMELDGADPSSVEFISMGTIDFTTAVRLNIADFYWVFYGWQGVHAELQGIAFDFLPLRDLAEVLDYYTPVLITSERMISEDPETVRGFLRATARGYSRAALDPDGSAELLLDYAPELDRSLVIASQRWLAAQSVEVIHEWGRQEEAVWTGFAAWALDNGLIETPIDASLAFTNAFLPGEAKEVE
ncbi:MAG: ABC transporter substrate-binding protein, partial [Candidatus Bipolaricaulia bacterium]